MSYYLRLSDSQLIEFNKSFTSFCNSLSVAAQSYAMLIDHILSKGAISGKTHDALAEFKQYAQQLVEITSDLGSSFKTILPQMISDIEVADSYLYDANLLSAQREYHQELYDRLQEFLAENYGQAGSTFASWCGGLFLGFLDLLTRPGEKNAVRVLLQKNLGHLLSFHEETSLGLKNLFDFVHAIDMHYSIIVSLFSNIMKEITALLQDMAAVADPKNKGGFAINNVKKIGKAVLRLSEHHKAVIDAINSDAIPTAEMIKEFIRDSENPGFDVFALVKQQFHNEYIDSTIWTQLWIGFFNSGEIFTDFLATAIRKYLEVDITFEEYLELRQMLETFESLDNKQHYEEIFDGLKEALKYAQDTGGNAENIFEYFRSKKYRLKDGSLLFDGRRKETKRLKSFFSNVESITTYGDKALEYIAILFGEYSCEMDFVESMERNANGDPKLQKTVGYLKKIYSNRMTAILNEGLDDAADLTYDWFKTAFPLYGTATGAIDIVGEATGVGTRYTSAYEAMQMEQVCGTSEQLYKNAVNKVQNLSPDDPDYAQDNNDLVSIFELHKNNMQKMYTNMANAMTGQKKAYYQYCAYEVGNMRIQDGTAPQLMSYEEYVKTDPYQGPREAPNLWESINYSDDAKLSDFHTGDSK